MAVDFKAELLNSVYKNVNVPGLAGDILDKVLEPVLKDAVAKSNTKIDDIAFAALYPILEAELKKVIKSEWDKLVSGEGAEVEGAPV